MRFYKKIVLKVFKPARFLRPRMFKRKKFDVEIFGYRSANHFLPFAKRATLIDLPFYCIFLCQSSLCDKQGFQSFSEILYPFATAVQHGPLYRNGPEPPPHAHRWHPGQTRHRTQGSQNKEYPRQTGPGNIHFQI